MATITKPSLDISLPTKEQTRKVTVTCNINFTQVELCQMKACPGRWFKLKCQLWGDDILFNGPNDHLYTFSEARYFPDATSTGVEKVQFTANVGEGLLDEDLGTDEVYAKLILTNLNTLVTVVKRSKVWSQSF